MKNNLHTLPILITALICLNIISTSAANPRPYIQAFFRNKLVHRDASLALENARGFYGISRQRFVRMLKSGTISPGPSNQTAMHFYPVGATSEGLSVETAFALSVGDARVVARRDSFFSAMGLKNYTKYSANEADVLDRIFTAFNGYTSGNRMPFSVRRNYRIRLDAELDAFHALTNYDRNAVLNNVSRLSEESGVVLAFNGRINSLRQSVAPDGMHTMIEMIHAPLNPAGNHGIPYTYVKDVYIPRFEDFSEIQKLIGFSGI
jgi:hypothetical protein